MAIPYINKLSSGQRSGIDNLLRSNRVFSDIDARNFAYATGNKDYRKFLGKTGRDITSMFGSRPTIGLPTNTIPQSFDTSMFGVEDNISPLSSANLNPNANLGGAQRSFETSFKSLQDYIQQSLNPLTEPLEEERSGLTSRLKGALDKLTGKSERAQQVLEETGYNKNIKQLQDLTTQIAQAQAGLQQGLTNIEGQAIPMELITGQQAELQRQGLSKIGALTSLAQAAQGNIALAQDTARQTLELEYGPLEQQITNLMAQLDINRENLTAAESKRAEGLNLYLNERMQQLNDEKAMRADILSLAQTAAQGGADSLTLNKILQSTSPEEAFKLAGEYMQAGVSPVSLSEGEILVNPLTGETIAQGNKKTESMPTSYQEWQLAGGEDGTGKSYAEFIGGQNGINPQIIAQVDRLASSFDGSPIVQNFNDLLNKKIGVQNVLELGASGPADVDLVYDFMKSLDPRSVVRGEEYEAAAKSGNIFKGGYAKFNGYFKEKGGFLPENVKQAFKDIIDVKFKAVQSQYNNLYNETVRKINLKTGMEDGGDYLTQYDISGSQQAEGKRLIQGETWDEIQGAAETDPYIGDVGKEILNSIPGLRDRIKKGDQEAILEFRDNINQILEAEGYTTAMAEQSQSRSLATNIQIGSRLGKVNNNPGNLRYAGQPGAVRGEGGFAKFPTPQAGYEALKNQIRLDASRGKTLQQFIHKYAPPGENNTNLYLQQMLKATGAKPGTRLTDINLDALAKAMARKESSTIIS